MFHFFDARISTCCTPEKSLSDWLCHARDDGLHLLDYALMVEECLPSLFAASLAMKGRASTKKLNSLATELGLV